MKRKLVGKGEERKGEFPRGGVISEDYGNTVPISAPGLVEPKY